MPSIHVLRSVIVAIAALAANPLAAAAAECNMAQMELAAQSVAEPCTALLNNPKLTNQQRAAAFYIRGLGYHRTHRLELAAIDYALALRATPDNEQILLALSNVDLRRGDALGYRKRVERAFQLNPKNAVVLRSFGRMVWWFGERGKAMQFYDEALRTDPTEPFALLFRAEENQRLRKLPEAIADANALVDATRPPSKPTGYLDGDGIVRNFRVVALINRAQILETAGQIEAALKDHDAAVAETPNAPALVARADFFRSRPNEDKKAIADLEAAVRIEPTDAPALSTLGMMLMGVGRSSEAFAALDKAIAAHPDDALALFFRARAHRQLGRTDEAFRDMKAAVQGNRQLLADSMPALRKAGYWNSPETPGAPTPESLDALRACMMDVSCN